MAAAHYARSTLEVYGTMSNIISRAANFANAPQLRPIERFWYQVSTKAKMIAAGKLKQLKK